MNKILFLFLFGFTLSLFTQINDYEKQKYFSLELMSDQEYYRAITELKRINSYFPENNEYIENLHLIAKCYELGEHKIEAINIHQNILKRDFRNWKSIYQISKLRFDI